MTIDINKVRVQLDSDDIIDHIELHASLKPILTTFLDRLEAAEKERDILRDKLALESQENGALRNSVDRACEERDALRNEIAYVKEVEFPRKAQAVADAWKGKCKRLEVERDILRVRIEAMEKQEPVGTTHAMPGASAFTMACFNASDVPVGTKLYTLPGAQPAPSVPDGVAEALQRLIENGAVLGPSSSEDALLVARYRQHLLSSAPSVPEGVSFIDTSSLEGVVSTGGQTMKYIACIGIGFFFGWLYAHSVIATECRKIGRFYIGKSVFNCTEAKS